MLSWGWVSLLNLEKTPLLLLNGHPNRSMLANGKQPVTPHNLFLYTDYPHMWHTEPWNDCSTPCGSGKQTRDVYCAKTEGERVSSKYCSKTKLPTQSRKCYGKQCGKVYWVIIRLNLCFQGAK